MAFSQGIGLCNRAVGGIVFVMVDGIVAGIHAILSRRLLNAVGLKINGNFWCAF